MSDPKQPAPAAATHRWDAMTWASVVNAACTLVALAIALFLGLRSMRVAEDSLRATGDSLRQSNLATIYTLDMETTKFFEANPKLSKFFDKMHRPPMTDPELEAEFQKLSEEQRVLVYLACERITDFMQVTFVQRDALPADEWDTWWRSFGDQYDESPVLRDYLAKRSTWYAFVEAIKPENRAKYFRGRPRK
jgi:hypothetical protein